MGWFTVNLNNGNIILTSNQGVQKCDLVIVFFFNGEGDVLIDTVYCVVERVNCVSFNDAEGSCRFRPMSSSPPHRFNLRKFSLKPDRVTCRDYSSFFNSQRYKITDGEKTSKSCWRIRNRKFIMGENSIWATFRFHTLGGMGLVLTAVSSIASIHKLATTDCRGCSWHNSGSVYKLCY